MRVVKPILALLTLALFMTGCGYIQIRIIQDCGWFALLRGSEWLWLFGACKR